MANNTTVNKVEYGGTTVMDITDTTAEANDVLAGKIFYAKSGLQTTGTLGNATTSTDGLMSSTDKTKLDNITTMVGATSSVNGTSGLTPAPTTGDIDKFLAGDGTYKSGGLPMVILSYGNSTWSDFISAYNNNVIVYCRASSNSNPATGAQGRMAFMAYINNATNPTEVEFQYYRSVNAHSATQMGDQVFVYKLNKTSGWSVTTREASIKQISAGSNGNLSVSWSSNKVTIDGGLPAVTSSDNGKTLEVANGAWSFVSTPTAVTTLWNNHLSGLRVYRFSSETITISANADTDIDFSSAIPQGVSAPWAVLTWISSGGTYYSLPYINNSGTPQTWVYGTINGTTLRIHSTVEWSNSIVYLVLITF